MAADRPKRPPSAELLAALKEAAAFAAGETVPGRVTRVDLPDPPNPAELRKRLKLTQEGFAARFGFPLALLQSWETGRRRPDGAAARLLRLIDQEPDPVGG